MVDVFTAWTDAAAGAESAADALISQIDVSRLRSRSVGIAACYYEFIETGVIAALHQKLKIDIIGCTATASSAQGRFGASGLALTVLSSDDVIFSSALSKPLPKNGFPDPLAEAYGSAQRGISGKPGLVLAWLPYIETLPTAEMFKKFSRLAGFSPVWGTVACDETMLYKNCRVFRNGESGKESAAMLLISGNINPKFFAASLPAQNVRKLKTIITESSGCTVKRVNGIAFREYLKGAGFDFNGVGTVPLMVDYGDGKPVALAIYRINDDGSALCGGEMPLGAAVAIGTIDSKGILETAKKTLEAAAASNPSGILVCSCVSRYMQAGEEELAMLAKMMEDGKIPWSLAYSGGEICPVADSAGVLHNRFHNYSFIACAL